LVPPDLTAHAAAAASMASPPSQTHAAVTHAAPAVLLQVTGEQHAVFFAAASFPERATVEALTV
jgi:hypothetical protein